jgi:hypothetical protein
MPRKDISLVEPETEKGAEGSATNAMKKAH